MPIFAYLGGGERGNRIFMKFCLGVGVHDQITHANLGDDQFRGFWGSGGRISHFSIDLRCRPWNTLALPCQHVIRYDLHRRTWPVFPGDIPNVQKLTSYVEAFESYRLTDRKTDRQTESHNRNYISLRFTGGKKTYHGWPGTVPSRSIFSQCCEESHQRR